MKFTVELTEGEGLKLSHGVNVVSMDYCPIGELAAGGTPYVREFGRAVCSLLVLMAMSGHCCGEGK